MAPHNFADSLTPVMPYDESDPVQSVVDCGLWMSGSVGQCP
ncbi:MAG TPA: hypothetical protein VIO62_14535 [Candidatus Dormibacteraeota bacterium]